MNAGAKIASGKTKLALRWKVALVLGAVLILRIVGELFLFRAMGQPFPVGVPTLKDAKGILLFAKDDDLRWVDAPRDIATFRDAVLRNPTFPYDPIESFWGPRPEISIYDGNGDCIASGQYDTTQLNALSLLEDLINPIRVLFGGGSFVYFDGERRGFATGTRFRAWLGSVARKYPPVHRVYIETSPFASLNEVRAKCVHYLRLAPKAIIWGSPYSNYNLVAEVPVQERVRLAKGLAEAQSRAKDLVLSQLATVKKALPVRPMSPVTFVWLQKNENERGIVEALLPLAFTGNVTKESIERYFATAPIHPEVMEAEPSTREAWLLFTQTPNSKRVSLLRKAMNAHLKQD